MAERQRVVVLGAGGLAREVRAMLPVCLPNYEFAGFVVSDPVNLRELDDATTVLGSVDELIDGGVVADAVVCAIGAPRVRARLFETIRAEAPHLSWPAVVAPTCIVSDPRSCVIGEGAVLCSGVVLTVSVSIGVNAYVNLNVTVGHEARIGDHSVVNPAANISGGVEAGDRVLVGTGAQVLQYVSIGSGAVVGAGACVTRDVAGGMTVVGVPAKPLVR